MQIRYIERKTGYTDDGPAWIARVGFSKSGRTVYFDGKALRRGQGIGANHYDIQTGEKYWISGVKRTAPTATRPAAGKSCSTGRLSRNTSC